MEIKFVRLRYKMRNLNGDDVSDDEISLYPGDTFNIVVPVLDEVTGLEKNVTIAVLSLVEGKGAIRDDYLDSILEEIIPEDDEWGMKDA